MGGILCGSALRSAIEGGRVFAPESIRADHIKPASYDVTLSRRSLVVYRSDTSTPESHLDAEYPDDWLRLAPGDSAIVASAELVQFDWNICGLLGQRFGLAQKGLIVHTGLMVDPGYGFKWDAGTEQWTAAGATTLRFIIQNAGSAEVTLHLGFERIARLALLEIDEAVEKVAVDEPYLARIGAGVALPQADGLTYYTHWRPHLDELRQSVLERAEAQAERDRIATTQLRRQAIRLDQVENSNNTVVLFGIYLIAATLLGVSFTVGVSVARDIFSSDDSSWLGVAGIVAILLWVGAQLAITLSVLQAFRSRTSRGEEHAGQSPAGGGVPDLKED